VTGAGEPTLVLVHGWALDRRLWDAQAPALAARHRVVTLDLAGHGESGRDRALWTMAALGDDVRAVVEAVGAPAVVLVGHSMGGQVVLEAARRLRDRVRGIVLVDTLLDVEERMPLEQVDALMRSLEGAYVPVATQMANEYLFATGTPPPVRERVLARVTTMPPALSAALLRALWTYDARPALREIQAPVRAVNADRFPTNVETNRVHMPGYRAVIVRGTGHYPMLEDPPPSLGPWTRRSGWSWAAEPGHFAVRAAGNRRRQRRPVSFASVTRTTSTGHGAWRTTASATLPKRSRPRPPRPCVVITTRSACSAPTPARIRSAGEPSATTARAGTPRPVRSAAIRSR
jgi:pimeloyl-ACP methyl ester carboxylesterase